MKGKMKKIIAAVATLAMAAQFAFALPASAETLYSQDFESVTDASSVMTSQNAQNLVSIGTDSTKYLQFVGDKSTNSRSSYSDFTVDLAGKDKYVVEFDASLKAGDKDGSQFIVRSGAGTLPAANSGYASDYILKMTCANSSTTWTINDVTTTTVNLTADTWYSFKLIVDTASKLGSLTIQTRDGNATVAADKIIIPMNGDCTKISGLYWLNGRYSCLQKIDNIVVRDMETTDDFGELPTEELSSLSWTAQVNRVIKQPAENEPVHIPVTVKATGTLGNDLTADSDITWSTEGIANEDGYISLTKAEGTELGTVGENPNGSATAYFNVRNGVSNWYGNVVATVTYGETTKVIKTPFAVIGASGGGNNLAPAAGYPENMSDYDDDLVGFKATADGINSQDVVLNNWSIYGSNGARTLTLEKDEDDTKYLRFASNGGGGSTVGVYQLADQPSQYIVDMTVRFTGGSMGFGHYKTTPNNTGTDPNWTASYASGSLTVGTGSIGGLSNDKWYRVVVSADESSNKLWAKVFDGATLVGEVDDQELAATSKATQNYFCFMGTWPVDLASFRIYSPTIGTIDLNATADTISVPTGDETPIRNLDSAGVFTYDTDSKALTIDTKDATVTKAKLITADYKDNSLSSMTASEDIVFTEGKATVANYTAKEGAQLYLWDGIDTIKPITDVVGTAKNMSPFTDPVVDLSALITSTEGFDMSSKVTWETDITDEEHISFVEDENDTHKATLTVTKGAPAGNITITARSGSSSVEKVINLTTTGNSIKFNKSVSSLTIPFTGEDPVEGEFEAFTVNRNGDRTTKAVDADGNELEADSTTTYAVLNSKGQDITASMPAGITFNTTTGKLTVTSEAKPAVLTIRATNNDVPALSSTVKVNIHGLSFAFGSDEPAEGLTQVQNDSYSDKIGYGFADASKVKVNAGNVEGTDAYTFKAKVPNGNYVINVTTSATSMTSEVVESVAATTGITKTDSTFKVAVCDGVLDLTFPKAATLTSLSISQDTAKTALAKPAVFAIGDSTTNNNANGALSWGNYASNHASELIGTTFSGFANHGMAGRDSVNFYNQARVEAVLLAVCPGDYVTVNMGINLKETGEGASYETLMTQYYVQAIIDRGAIPVIVTATPDGPVGTSVAADYDASTGKFTNNRGNGARNDVLRKIAKAKGLNLIELGQAGEDWLNNSTLDELKAYGGDTTATDKLTLVQSWYTDHNHYKEPMAKWVAEFLFTKLNEIVETPNKYVQAAE